MAIAREEGVWQVPDWQHVSEVHVLVSALASVFESLEDVSHLPHGSVPVPQAQSGLRVVSLALQQLASVAFSLHP